MPNYTTREALGQAAAILTALPIDASVTLTTGEQTRVVQGVQECHGALIQLNGQNTLPVAERAAREASLMAAVSSLNVVEAAHPIPPEKLYNALDLMMAVAGAIAEGDSSVSAG